MHPAKKPARVLSIPGPGWKPLMTLRSPEQIARFFDALDLLEPGVVPCSRWRPDISPMDGQPPPVDEFCGVARKP